VGAPWGALGVSQVHQNLLGFDGCAKSHLDDVDYVIAQIINVIQMQPCTSIMSRRILMGEMVSRLSNIFIGLILPGPHL
jgi:hypothetical protein